MDLEVESFRELQACKAHVLLRPMDVVFHEPAGRFLLPRSDSGDGYLERDSRIEEANPDDIFL